jgi:hypothetical protein
MLSGRALAALLVVIAEAGCVPVPRKYTKEQLVGTYEITYSFGTDTLILNSDNTYEQHFVDADGNVYTNRGKWDLEEGRDNQVALINAVDVCSPTGQFASTHPHPGWSMRSFGWAWWRGRTVISVSGDLDLYMRKIR